MTRKIRTVQNISTNYDKLGAPNTGIKMRPSVGLDDSVGEYLFIRTKDIEPYDKQARKIFDESELHNMAETIKIYGVRNPLTVIKGEKPGAYYVISGERRLRSAIIAGLEKVPCIILGNESFAEEISVIENIQRSDLHPIELCNAYASLLKDFNYGDQTKLAQKLGVSNTHLSEILSLKRLPEDIKKYLLEKNIRTRSILRKVVNESDIEAVKVILDGDKEQLAKKDRRKFALRVYFQGESAILSGIKKKMSMQQKESLVTQLKDLIQKLDE